MILGVLGGGQLGKYFVLAAKKMGYQTAVLDPDPQSPAGACADTHLIAHFDDAEALQQMASICSAITVEFENPPVSSLEFLSQFVTVRPSPNCVAIAQDRQLEKRFCESIGLLVAPYEVLETREDATRIERHGIVGSLPDPFKVPLIMKTSRMGYDGKGQQTISKLSEIASLWDNVANVPCVVEQALSLDFEFSVILTRGHDGKIALFAPTRNAHIDGILDVSTAPLITDPAWIKQGERAAIMIAEQLHYVGVLAVEFFVSDARVFVNEIAPRPHNSGHWTLDSARTSQFEQQVRALTGMKLGDPSMKHNAVAMVNLLGQHWANGEPQFAQTYGDSDAHLHLYGKQGAHPGRKMGHITVTGEFIDDVRLRAIELRNLASR